MLLHALREHDGDWQGYTRRQRDVLRRYTPGNPELVAEYDTLLARLIGVAT
jgi:hypothetical protein